MKRKITLLVFIFVWASNIKAQQINSGAPTILKSTINSIGVTSVQKTLNNRIVVQSIGQSGIIGQKKTTNLIIQQGFLNNSKYYVLNNNGKTEFEETIDIVISPNPFIDHVKIDFSVATKNPIYIKLYDTNGKSLIYKSFAPSKSIIVPLRNYSIGNYLIHIISGSNNFAEKIFKTR